MSVTQREKGERFRRLHEGPCFVIPNPWDVGSAKVLAGMGFAALATSSAASAAGKGKHDGELTREEALGHARTIVGATELPVSADLENGFGDTPAAVAQTVRLAGEAGLVGCTIEDTKGENRSRGTAKSLYDFELAVERVAAGVKAARALGFPFLLTARTHNLLFAGGQLEETGRRLQAFEKAGADVLFAPGLPDLAAVRAVCGALTKPFNFMVGIPGRSFSVSELAAAGVRRISLATSLYRAAMTGFLDAAREVQDRGTFTFLDRSVNTREVVDLMGSSR
ncbi:MAG TPA: isocitrate lyase/phosphoenolpyruvate mutase family protein [Candidatus Acidoferrum sp.]|nr:isocitrate lyase/phosphoenolpyruvate mutase family protein [Candidatus Acidoferrum sp.]